MFHLTYRFGVASCGQRSNKLFPELLAGKYRHLGEGPGNELGLQNKHGGDGGAMKTFPKSEQK